MPAPQVSSKPNVFISYRREDSAGHVLAIHDGLTLAFGSAQVFKDTDSIPAGRDFVAPIEDAIARSDVILAVIDKGWLTETNAAGVRRIDNPTDFVRMELETALQRGIPVIPVLVGGADAPRVSELPPTLSRMASYYAIPIRNDYFQRDLDDLIQRLHRSADAFQRVENRRVEEPPTSYPSPSPPPGAGSDEVDFNKPLAGGVDLGGGATHVSLGRDTQSDVYHVWFGTNRQPVIDAKTFDTHRQPLTWDGALIGFSSSRHNQTHYGTCEVAIPKSHKIGSIGSPLWKRIATLTDDRLKLQENRRAD